MARVASDAREAQSYVYDHGNTDTGGIAVGKVWNFLSPGHDAAIEATHKMLGHLKAIASESDANLNKTANYYRHTEHAVAASVDATYPEVQSRLSQRDLTESRYEELTGRTLTTYDFADARNARATLREPEAAELDAFEKLLLNPGGIFDYLSPSNAASQVIQLIINRDPVEWFIEWFAGDWKKLYECGEALENIGAMMDAISTNIHMGANELSETWTGNAAGAASKYFADLAVAVDEQQALLARLGQKYKVTAMGILRMQETTVGIIKGMFDAALIGAAAASAGVATSETGAGGLVGGLIAGVEATRIWEMWERAKMMPEKATEAGNSFIGFLQASTSTMTHFAQHPLPARGYRSPVV